jgi:hypothetical protein
MDSLPFVAQGRQICDQSLLDSLTALANDMHMGRPMIVRVDHGAPSTNAQDGRHIKLDTTNLSGLVFVTKN